ncbi:hypothetical protein ACU635_21605 [[Actinomadura] parvosata]|uniref:hypothetical protein n=1 Tax=[Actinomadura] parvosata TaxID=1955412 RepID=UPI00406CBD49
MRHSSMIAALLAPAVIGTLGLTTPAYARAAPPAARAAWIKSCYDKKRQDTDPCGAWRLRLRDGGQATVPGAATRGVTGKGREAHLASTFAVSGDGRVLLYERARDHRLVVRPVSGGPAKVLPEDARPKGIGSDEMAVRLSPSGERVLIDYYDADDRLPSKVITVATGETATVPAAYGVLGLSAAGDEVLATRLAGDNTTTLYALRPGGGSTRRTPPQVIANAGAWALAADGTTVAALVQGDAERKEPARIRTYDLATGELSEGVDVPAGRHFEPSSAWWDGDLLRATYTRTASTGNSAVVRVLTVDPGTGRIEQDDQYKIGENYAFAAAGE